MSEVIYIALNENVWAKGFSLEGCLYEARHHWKSGLGRFDRSRLTIYETDDYYASVDEKGNIIHHPGTYLKLLQLKTANDEKLAADKEQVKKRKYTKKALFWKKPMKRGRPRKNEGSQRKTG